MAEPNPEQPARDRMVPPAGDGASRGGVNRMKYIAVGTEFIVTFGIFLGGGLMLDWRLGSVPGFTLLGGAIGFALALNRLVRQGQQIMRERDAGDQPSDRPNDEPDHRPGRDEP